MSTYRYCKISAASHNMKLFCRISAANEFKVFILCRAADILQHKYDENSDDRFIGFYDCILHDKSKQTGKRLDKFMSNLSIPVNSL